jgi:hypothetical protein
MKANLANRMVWNHLADDRSQSPLCIEYSASAATKNLIPKPADLHGCDGVDSHYTQFRLKT